MIDRIGHGTVSELLNSRELFSQYPQLPETLEPEVMVDLLRKSDIKIHKFGCGEPLTLKESRLRCLRAYLPKKDSFQTAVIGQIGENPEQASIHVKQELGEVVGDAVSSTTEETKAVEVGEERGRRIDEGKAKLSVVGFDGANHWQDSTEDE